MVFASAKASRSQAGGLDMVLIGRGGGGAVAGEEDWLVEGFVVAGFCGVRQPGA